MELRGIASGASMNTIHRYRRFDGWDYSRGASFFITIATAPRRALFGRVRGGGVVLSALGRKVDEALLAMPRLNPGLSIFGRVVMPDHVHFNCALAPGLKEPLKVLGFAVRRFKNYTTKLAKSASLASLAEHSSAIKSMANEPGSQARFDGQTVFGQLWQQGYHDYLLLSRSMIDSTERYIAYNPMKWELMYGEGGGLRVVEPLSSPRLDLGDYWKGVGNIALLSPDEKLVSLRVSREVATTAAIAAVVRRMENAVEKGYVVISGFISKGERAVRDMLARRRDAKFIRILPSCIPNRRFKPESVYIEPFGENRYLEIARGNDETEFGRRACLDLNAEIIEIATSGEGLALYWKADGPHVLAGLAEHGSAIKSGGGMA
jgi:REP element-mobilizing transposase RayT